nr:MAG: hypothetical protein AM324_00970 [Candidatus Thorarchaeota archaeon SMTZ1-83]
MRWTRIFTVLIIGVAFVTGYSIRKPSQAEWVVQSLPSTSVSYEELEESRTNAIVEAARKVSPAVVSISVIQTRYYSSSPIWEGDFFERFFREFSPPRVYSREVQSLGSGFIVNPEGYVLTNEHLVRSGEKIKITLPDGREFDAAIAGRDEALDIALLKIDSNDLPVAPLGDSDKLIIGEWAIAIGNPFGYLLEDPMPSVTAGVISAFHRDIKPRSGWISAYKDMIQTDAAINPGNSGGPLVNAEGEVIGINTFIFTAGGGSEGIGFAIPINTAKKALDELVQYGEVREVWLGIDVQELTPELAEMIEEQEGVMVTDVERDGAAERAGVRAGDLIIGVNQRKVRNLDDWEAANSSLVVGEEVTIHALRDHDRVEFILTATEPPEIRGKKVERLGIVVQNVTPYLRSKFKLDVKTGVVVIDVKPGSQGEVAGVEVGDVILAIEKREIKNVDDFEGVPDVMHRGELSLVVDRRGTKLHLSYMSTR